MSTYTVDYTGNTYPSYGKLPCGDNSTISTSTFANMQVLLNESITANSWVSNGVVSTYSLVYTDSNGAYAGGVLSSNGDIHMTPCFAPVGQKISPTGTVSTYSLLYTTSVAYLGGVLAPNGDIHFIPASATTGQKVSASGLVSTYSLVASSYNGGVVGIDGTIYMVPYRGFCGAKNIHLWCCFYIFIGIH